ncbi:SNAP receptor [Aureococcus anophagefferens]|nr:SNAP receptor [Aureococcus anophagefferens]
MKVLHVAIMRFTRDTPEPVVLCQEADLSSFGFFEKSTVKQMLQFFSKTVVSRVKAGQRITIEQEQMKEYQVHCFVNSEGWPRRRPATRSTRRAAFNMLGQLMEQFGARVRVAGGRAEKRASSRARGRWRAQDPAAFDKIIKIQNDLDDTTAVLHQTIDNLSSVARSKQHVWASGHPERAAASARRVATSAAGATRAPRLELADPRDEARCPGERPKP